MDVLIDIDIELLELGFAPEPQLAPDAIEYLVANDRNISPSPFQPIADMLPDDFRDGRDQIDERYMEFVLATFDLEFVAEADLTADENKTTDKPNFNFWDDPDNFWENPIPDVVPEPYSNHGTVLEYLSIPGISTWAAGDTDTTDEIFVYGVRHNNNGTIDVFGFTFGGSHPNAENINFCTGIDVISSVGNLTLLGGLANLGGFLGDSNLFRTSSGAARTGGFAGFMGALFLGSAGHACGNVGL